MPSRVRGFATGLDALRAWMSGASGAAARQSAQRVRLDALTDEVNRLNSDPTIRAVLDLHRPVVQENSPWPVCTGCDRETPDEDYPEWPCTTWTIVAQRLRSQAAAREPGDNRPSDERPTDELSAGSAEATGDQPKRPEM